MTETATIQTQQQRRLTPEAYQELYHQSINAPDVFWAEMATRYLDWDRRFDDVISGSFAEQNVRWFEGGKLNASYQCLDRHLSEKSQQTAFIFEPDSPDMTTRDLSYQDLHDEVCRMANVLKSLGVVKGKRVCIYLPMIPEAAIAMLACARLGAIHTVVFAGFSSQALADRINDAECSLVITADEGLRGGKTTPLKANVDDALKQCASVTDVLVVRHTGADVSWSETRDHCWLSLKETVSTECPCELMEANDPLFILYTSGSTGKPKGVLHSTAAYLLYVTMSFDMVFGMEAGDVYWCGADVGWVTGHSYMVYGPLANGVSSVLYEGVPTCPTPARYWQVIDKHRVSHFYTAPTALRALMREGDEWLTTSSRRSLKLLGSVGEPINPDVWQWYFDIVGRGQCDIIDTWWQTETGGMMIVPIPGVKSYKPGAASLPFFGIEPVIIDQFNQEQAGEAEGRLQIKQPWPGLMLSVFGDHQRFVETYFDTGTGYYVTGDGARRDAEGDYWIAGRLDDVLNVSGHRLGTAEIENALLTDHRVAEAAVCGVPHAIKGEGIYAFVTLKKEILADDDIKSELMAQVRRVIGPIAKPDSIQWAEALPKTRSGKIMRRILRKIASGEHEGFGDTSTLADPSVIEALIARLRSV